MGTKSALSTMSRKITNDGKLKIIRLRCLLKASIMHFYYLCCHLMNPSYLPYRSYFLRDLNFANFAFCFRMALLLLMMGTVKLSEERLLLYQDITWLHTIWVVLNPRQVQFENVGYYSDMQTKVCV